MRLACKFYLTLTILLVLQYSAALQAAEKQTDVLFQYSAINALLAGVFDGEITVAELAQHGSMGLGTINGIDGELIVLDNQFYSIKADGMAYPLAPTEKSPFAVMSFFEPELNIELQALSSISELSKQLDMHINAKNAFQAIRIDGSFNYLKVRSEPKQKPPFRPLAIVMKEQQVSFNLNNVAGTLIGYRTPGYMRGLNVPGYHFHFITQDHRRGGHVLEVNLKAGQVQIDNLSQLNMVLPNTDAFHKTALKDDREDELKSVEQQ